MSAVLPTGAPSARYLDAASGLPMSVTVAAALRSAWSAAWADPSRRYPVARTSRDVLESSRASVAGLLGCPPAGAVFTADPAAAAEFAVTGMGPDRVLLSAVESLPVLRLGDVLRDTGRSVTQIPVDANGRLDHAALVAATKGSQEPVVLVLQAANPEIGTRQDLAGARAVLPQGSVLVSDATAVLGRDRLPDGWDALWADPRMWGGPGGIGLLAVREPDRLAPPSAFREGHLGLEPAPANVPLVAAAAFALEQALASLSAAPPDPDLIDWLRSEVSARIADVMVLGHPTERVTHIAMFSFLYVAADELVEALARRGWSVASGASCTSDTLRPHHVLVAIGASTHGSLRVSLPPETDPATLAQFVSDLCDVVALLRAEAGVTDL